MRDDLKEKILKAKIKKERKSFNILALDVATHCGWAVSNQISGVWDLSIKRDESSGMRLLRFKTKLLEIIESQNINLVAFERSAGFHKNALVTQAELHGVLKLTLETLGIEYRAFSAKEIKKFATGNGNAGKPLMIKAAQEKYGYIGKDDNEADALHILNLIKSSLV
jgi:Holliday junction resolvasome RuvABC endonuclease subunit